MYTDTLPQNRWWCCGTLDRVRSEGEKGDVYENFTKDNKTQWIMERSQWDLKQIHFQRRCLTRLEDFVTTLRTRTLHRFADAEKKHSKGNSVHPSHSYCQIVKTRKHSPRQDD
ncbi:hypothetical protein AMEX_G8327 [Astyanax mexicanus]|uniref:Uncharacterized protein n=1 Tax=Astyanax mexicanus TaxID=7994 RepID=A0A8T2LXC1_ASTMX|nr:hypothetical protein AMEX_G8327 [Astyanax mexicanus]